MGREKREGEGRWEDKREQEIGGGKIKERRIEEV